MTATPLNETPTTPLGWESEMPAKTRKQQKFMGGCAHNPEQMDKKCPPKSVAREFAHMPKRTKPRGRG